MYNIYAYIYLQTSHNLDARYWEVTFFTHNNKGGSTLKRGFSCTPKDTRRPKSAFRLVTLCHHLLAEFATTCGMAFYSSRINRMPDSMGSSNFHNT